jgi:hypothetical protein
MFWFSTPIPWMAEHECTSSDRTRVTRVRRLRFDREFEPMPQLANEHGYVMPIHRVEPRCRGSKPACIEIGAEIDCAGVVMSAGVVKKTPPGSSDGPALRAYERWRYCPLETGAPDAPRPTTVWVC